MNSKKLFIGTGVVLLIIACIATTVGLVGGTLFGFVLVAVSILLFITGIELIVHPNVEDFMQVVYTVINFFTVGPYIEPPAPQKKKDDK